MANPATSSDETYDRIHRKTWGKRTSGFLGAATLFAGLGMVGGAIASFLPAALEGLGVPGASAGIPAATSIVGNMALFAGASAWLGLTIGADVGANSGAATAVIEEPERRDRARGLAPTQDKAAAPAAKPKLFNWKTSLVMGALFAAFGAMVAMSPITAPVVALMGLKAGTAAAGIVAGAVLGMFGMSMGMNFPVISNKLSNKYSEILKGDAFEKSPAQTPEPALAATRETASPAPETQPEMQAGAEASTHSGKLVKFSVTSIKSRTEACDHTHETGVHIR